MKALILVMLALLMIPAFAFGGDEDNNDGGKEVNDRALQYPNK